MILTRRGLLQLFGAAIAARAAAPFLAQAEPPPARLAWADLRELAIASRVVLYSAPLPRLASDRMPTSSEMLRGCLRAFSIGGERSGGTLLRLDMRFDPEEAVLRPLSGLRIFDPEWRPLLQIRREEFYALESVRESDNMDVATSLSEHKEFMVGMREHIDVALSAWVNS